MEPDEDPDEDLEMMVSSMKKLSVDHVGESDSSDTDLDVDDRNHEDEPDDDCEVESVTSDL